MQWYFSKFLLSPAADNWFFAGNRYWWYFSQPGDWMHEFWHNNHFPKNPLTVATFMRALLYAFISARVGLSFGRWMSTVKQMNPAPRMQSGVQFHVEASSEPLA